jgi:hypothetical protein
MIEIIDNLELYGQRPYYWLVGSCFGGDAERNQITRFLNNNIWEDGWGKSGDERNRELLSNVRVGDYFLLKSCFAQNATSITRLKRIGRVSGKSQSNYYTFLIKWYNEQYEATNFKNISYRVTIEMVRNDELLAFAKDYIQAKKL